MKSRNLLSHSWRPLFFILITLCSTISNAQQLKISDFVLFGGSAENTIQNPYSTGVKIGSNVKIQGGFVGSYGLIKSTGKLTLSGDVYSDRNIQLSNYNEVGNISAANSKGATGNILSIGYSAKITGNIDVNGDIAIKSGTVSGKVTHPPGSTYTGPLPGGGNITAAPALPVLPGMPA